MTDFSLRTTPTWLDGIYLALVGVPDLWVVLDAGRCVAELMVESGLESHAWRQRLMRLDGEDRLFVTDAGPSRIETGGSARMLERLADLAVRRRPGAVLVSGMTPSRIAGEDQDALATAVSTATGAPARAVEHLSLTRDWLDAIGAAMVALARALPDAACTGDRDTVAVIGHLFDRDEADCRADVRELTRLVESLGVEVSSVWTAGEPVARLASAGASRHLLALPYGSAAARAIASRSGARVIDVPLPVGLEGTAAWLRTVGAWLGRDAEAGRAVEEGLREVVPPIGPLVPRAIAGRRIGVVADPALAEGLGAYLAELGAEVVPPLVRCRREESVPAALRGPRPGGVRPHDPSLDSLGAWVRAAEADGPLDLVVGSSRERELLKSSGVPFLELGFPSIHWRPLVAAPTLGFAGALHLAHRISNRLADTGFERMARDKA